MNILGQDALRRNQRFSSLGKRVERKRRVVQNHFMVKRLSVLLKLCPKKKNVRLKWIPECTKQDIYDELMLYIQDHGRNCEYCKEPWTHSRASVGIRGGGARKRGPAIDTNFSIDRLDSEKTYIPDNLVFCCIGCNNRKNQVRLSDLINILRVWVPRKIGKEEYEL